MIKKLVTMVSPTAYFRNLRLLCLLRVLALSGESIAILITTKFFQIPLPEHLLWPLLGIMGCIAGGTWVRLRTPYPLSELEFFIHIVLDSLGLFALLFLTGGAMNPFTTLFVLHVMIAAITLRPLMIWGIAAISIMLYTILMFWHLPLQALHHHYMGHDVFSLHLQGMWLSFILLCGMIAWFVVRMNKTIHYQQARLADAETLAAMGSLAANAAHELGTPLASLTLLAEQMKTNISKEELHTNADLVHQLLTRCKTILTDITTSVGQPRATNSHPTTLEQFLHTIMTSWQARKPAAKLDVVYPSTCLTYQLVSNENIQEAIHRILDNAFDASQRVWCHMKCSDEIITIFIKDEGKGLSKEEKKRIASPGFSTKPNGLGLGTFLAKSTIARCDGTITWETNRPIGTCVTITLPLMSFLL